MRLPIRCCLALAATLSLAHPAWADVDLAATPHVVGSIVIPDGSTAAQSHYVMVLTHESDVTIRATALAHAPFIVGEVVDSTPYAAASLFTGEGTQATFAGRFDAGFHDLTFTFAFPTPSLGAYLLGTTIDFSAVTVPDTGPGTGPDPSAVPEPGTAALMLAGGLGLGVSMRRRLQRRDA